MKGKYEVVVGNRRIRYKFTIERNITILRGDSATGKTTLVDMIYSYQQNGMRSGVDIRCSRPCVVIDKIDWQSRITSLTDSIIFIDEGDPFVTTAEFASVIKNTSNYYVIVTRSSLFSLPYSVNEIYGIKNKSGNRYQGTRRLYSTFYPLHENYLDTVIKPECIIVEDSNAGYEFFCEFAKRYQMPCISAKGKSNIFHIAASCKETKILIIADGAAFGPEIERILSLREQKDIMLYLPESFEWNILNSGIIELDSGVIAEPYDYVDSQKYFSWEQFFTDYLMRQTRGTYLEYHKQKLNTAYIHGKVYKQIIESMPELQLEESHA